jgi:hypothetical protein
MAITSTTKPTPAKKQKVPEQPGLSLLYDG